MVLQRYSSAQRVCFACLVVGFLLCVVGGIPNRWVKGKIGISDLLKFFDISFFDFGINAIEVHGGVWWVCYSSDLLPAEYKEGCEKIAGKDADGNVVFALVFTRILCFVNISLALLSALAACCRGCCCKGGRTIFHGIVAFLSGATGLAAIIHYVGNSSGDILVSLLLNIEYDWAIYIYGIGSGLITIVSLFLCFMTPTTELPTIIPGAGSNTYVHLQHQNTMGPINSAPTGQAQSQQAVGANWPPQQPHGYGY